MRIKVAAIIVAAGTGTRFGGLKQLELLEGRRIVDISLSIARPFVDYVVCVKTPTVDFGSLEADMVVDGGDTRSGSVRIGLEALPEDVDFVLVHDAARPLASGNLYLEILSKLEHGSTAVVPVVAVSDTIKEVEDGRVVRTADRSRLFLTQTPQGFSKLVLVEAHRSGLDATDDAQLAEMIGVPVDVIPGETSNFKITTMEDLDRASHLLKDRIID
jgi:2-C-methyl-D-erythritol 4-phosphate cytidylyltransferase